MTDLPGEDGLQYDVFISYSSKDKDWVRGELLTRIEQSGLRAFIDFRDFNRGAPSIKECERGVRVCRKTLVILTPNYVKSGWTDIESVMVQSRDPANDMLRLIPALKADCEKPLRLGVLTHIDFRDGEDRDLAWRQLLESLGPPLKPPPLKPPAPPTGWYLENPYPMPPNFTGRVTERRILTEWLNGDTEHPLLCLRALGGFGKSALVWHWLTHDVDAAAWPKVVWWSFYEADAGFEAFLADSLAYLSDGAIDPTKLAPKEQVTQALRLLQAPGALLVLDGFERALRAFGGLGAAYQGDEAQHTDKDRECISPIAEQFLYNIALQPLLRSKVLLTTRLRPRILEPKGGGLWQGCREAELNQMDPEDAADFFIARKIRGTRAELKTACATYGYHPLSLCLLAGVIIGDLQQPRDIGAAARIDVSGDLIQRQHHVLQVAYDNLSPGRQALLGRIACFRSPMKYEALQALAKVDAAGTAPLDTDLRDLVSRGLLNHDTREGRFDLHPIVRRYAYDRLAAPDRAAAHTSLRDYFAAVPRPAKVVRLEDLTPVIELYHHTLRAGQFDEAYALYRARIDKEIYYRLGAYQVIVDLLRGLFPDGEERPARLKDESNRAILLNDLACAYSLSGRPRRAVPLFERQLAIREKQDNKLGMAIGFLNVSDDQRKIGMLRVAEIKLRRSLLLFELVNDEHGPAQAHLEIGLLLAHRGSWTEAKSALAIAMKRLKSLKDRQTLCVAWGYHARLAQLSWRSAKGSSIRTTRTAIAPASRMMSLVEGAARDGEPNKRDYVSAHWVLGAAHRLAGEHADAERHLHEALQHCRSSNMVDNEADILIDLARLNAATNQPVEARRIAEEALAIADRCGYVLQGADANIELARLALNRGDRPTATQHAKDARRLATCDGPPDYTYKVAYDEAGALLK